MTRLAACFGFLVFLTSAVSAQPVAPAEKPDLKVGDRWAYRAWSGTITETYWYAPEVERLVKREYRDTVGGRTWEDWRDELIGYEVK